METFNSEMTPEELGYFLQECGLQDDIASAVVQHNISGAAFIELTEDDLKELIPRIGDRIAIRRVVKRIRDLVSIQYSPAWRWIATPGLG